MAGIGIGRLQDLSNTVWQARATTTPANATAAGENQSIEPADTVELSPAAQAQLDKVAGMKKNGDENTDKAETAQADLEQRLAVRDADVVNHETAHLVAAGGGVANGIPHYTYQTGPDGKNYAVGGEVKVDLTPDKDPRITISKMEHVIRAAMAPSDSSAQDQAVVAAAEQVEAQARIQLAQENQAKQKSGSQQAGVVGLGRVGR
jgi:hypothetical protein